MNPKILKKFPLESVSLEYEYLSHTKAFFLGESLNNYTKGYKDHNNINPTKIDPVSFQMYDKLL